MSHKKSILIMLDMAHKGKLNEQIIQDMNTAVVANAHVSRSDA